MIKTSKELPKIELEQKGYKIFGYDYCITDHYMECGCCVLTNWKCKIFGTAENNSDTNVPELCNTCARMTVRCNHCGKLKNK